MIDNLEGEIWKDIEDYTGLYQVSNIGRVKSLNYNHTGTEHILKPLTRNKYGYKYVELWKNKNKQKVAVHRLVAQSFIPNPDNKPVIDHIDTNTGNNCVENLRWCTHYENSQNQLTIEHHNQKSIYCFETDKFYKSTHDAARQLNVHSSAISRCCKRERKSAGGYHFCYASDIKKED